MQANILPNTELAIKSLLPRQACKKSLSLDSHSHKDAALCGIHSQNGVPGSGLGPGLGRTWALHGSSAYVLALLWVSLH